MVNSIITENLLDAASALDLVISDFSCCTIWFNMKELIPGRQDIDTVFLRSRSATDIVDLLDSGTIQLGLNDMFSIITKGKRSIESDVEYSIVVMSIPCIVIELSEGVIASIASTEAGNRWLDRKSVV